MQAVAVMSVTEEYDLLDEDLSTKVIESYFGKPLAIWEPATLEPGEVETVQKAFVRSAETRTIEIDREDHVVWVSYVVSVEMVYNPGALDYFGAKLDDIVRHACHVSFPLDQRKVEYVDEDAKVHVT